MRISRLSSQNESVTFESYRQAGESVGVPAAQIKKACANKKPFKGFWWKSIDAEPARTLGQKLALLRLHEAASLRSAGAVLGEALNEIHAHDAADDDDMSLHAGLTAFLPDAEGCRQAWVSATEDDYKFQGVVRGDPPVPAAYVTSVSVHSDTPDCDDLVQGHYIGTVRTRDFFLNATYFCNHNGTTICPSLMSGIRCLMDSRRLRNLSCRR